jgi:hypothetical protein
MISNVHVWLPDLCFRMAVFAIRSILDQVLLGFEAYTERFPEIGQLLLGGRLALFCLALCLFLRLLLCLGTFAAAMDSPCRGAPGCTLTRVV